MSGEVKTGDRNTADGRRFSFSALRVAACLGIVLLHTANVSEILYREELSAGASAFALGIVYLMMWAVPAFLMVSGALLLDPVREAGIGKIFKQYIRRVAGALVVCCILFRLFDLLMNKESFSLMFIPDGIFRMFTGQSWAHLWYLYLLIGLYLLLPFYRMIAVASDARMMQYLLLVYLIFLSILPVTAAFGVTSAFEIQTAAIYPFYFFAGHALYSGKLRLNGRWPWILFAGGTSLIVIMIILRSMGPADLAAPLTTLLGSYASPAVVLQSVGLFALISGRYAVSPAPEAAEESAGSPAAEVAEESAGSPTAEVAEESAGSPAPEAADSLEKACEEVKAPVKDSLFGLQWLKETVELIDGAGFGIYLLHMVFLRLFLRYEGWNLFLVGGWSFFAFAIGIFLLTAVPVTLLKKVPYVRAIL